MTQHNIMCPIKSPSLPSHPPVRFFNSSNIGGSSAPRDPALEGAALAFWQSFNPRPIRPLSKQDLVSASEALGVWERKLQAGVPNMTELRAYKLSFLVLDMLQALKRVSLTLTVTDTFQKSLKRRIQVVIGTILTEILDKKVRTIGASEFLTDLSERIDTNFLRPGDHSIQWATTELPFILDLLEVWPRTDLPADLIDTGILERLKSIYEAPCLPIALVSQSLRIRAFNLHNSQSKSQLISKNRDFTTDAVQACFFDIGNLAMQLQNLESAAALADAQGVQSALQRLKYWYNIDMDLDLVFAIRKSFSKVHDTLREKRSQWRPAELNQIRLQMKLISSEDLRFETPKSFSYRHLYAMPQILPDSRAATREGIVIKFIKAPFGGHSYEYATQGPARDIIMTCSSLELPAQVMFDSFVAEWNKYNRHPLWPLVTFELQRICKLAPGYWVQGSLESVLRSFKHNADGHFEIYYRVIRNDSFEEKKSQQIGMLLAWERIVGMFSSSSWVQPSAPAQPRLWMQVPTLSFVGSGSEIHPNISYPPIVASHIWVPKEWEELGLNPRYLTQHLPCAKISVTSRKMLTDGGFLSEEEARSLVGRTVQFATRVPVNQMAKSPYENKRSSACSAIDNVFVSFIWGFDPERMILRGIERDNTERCRTFFIGNEKRFPVLDDRAAWRNANRNELEPIRPVWIGPVETNGQRH
ncbi:hypothetical protein VKT23_001056 [Stygiomarasmius scandens]|uniref:Uncharacterized protein n=1 Tax=Marasmiellus scandens TaxID=2682957 RepID=A0ABR1K9S5_9AGAR